MWTQVSVSLKVALILLLLAFQPRGLANDSTPAPGSQASSPTASSAKPRSNGSLRLIAVKKNGQAVTDLRPEDLRLTINGQASNILSVSSTASLPKTIGIFIDGSYFRGFDSLIGKETGAIIRFLESDWRERDVGFVVSFSDKIYKDVPPTSDLAKIENAFPKILARDFDRPWGWNGDLDYCLRHDVFSWYNALLRAPIFTGQPRGGEKVYIILSDFWGTMLHRQEIKILLNQRARIFPLLVFVPDDINERPTDYFDVWKAQGAAEKVAKNTGGDIFPVLRRKDLARIQRRLKSELESAYLVTYEPVQGSAAENIKIVCHRPDIRLLYPTR